MTPQDFMKLLPVVTVYASQVNIETRMIGEKKDRPMRTQTGYINKPGREHPDYFKFQLTDDQLMPYPAGQYFISAESYGVGDYDAVSINRFGVKLIAIPQELQLKRVA